MEINKLIEKLTEIRDKYGDGVCTAINVNECIAAGDEYDYMEVESVNYVDDINWDECEFGEREKETVVLSVM